MREKTAKIYVLLDSKTGIPRYVGFTTQKLNRRLNQHWYTRNGKSKYHYHNYNWIRSLKSRPKILLLEEGKDVNHILKREEYWIRYFKKKGFKLTNSTDGGEGVKSLGWSDYQYSIMQKSVDQYDMEGNFLKAYDSIVEAAISIGGKQKNPHITSVCKGKKPTAFGYIWRYKGEPFDKYHTKPWGKPYSEESIKRYSKSKMGKKNPMFGKTYNKHHLSRIIFCKKWDCIDRKYLSVKEASEKESVSVSSIHRAIKNNRGIDFYGNYWHYGKNTIKI